MTAASGSPLLATVFGLLAALTWGGGDFAGGMGSKAVKGSVAGTFRVVMAAHGLSLAVLLGLAMWHGDPLPRSVAQMHQVAWAMASGVAAGLSISAFYIALSSGEMGIAASISGLITAAIPAVVGWVTEGRPTSSQVAGFIAAAAAIYLIAASGGPSRPANRRTQVLALCSGVGFGAYLVCLRMADGLGAFEPVALARIGSVLTTALLLAVVLRARPEPPVRLSRPAWLAVAGIAVLDSAGNLLFLAASHVGRLDIAGVLASLYPVSTILLAAVWLKERPTLRQWIGIGAALAGVALMAA